MQPALLGRWFSGCTHWTVARSPTTHPRMDVFKKQKTYADPDFSPTASEILVWAIKNKKELFAKLCKVRGWEPKGEIAAEAQFPIHKGGDENIMGELVGFTDLYLHDDKNNFFVTIKSKVASFGFGAELRELKLHRHDVSYAWELELPDIIEHYTFVLLAPSIEFEDLIREDCESCMAIDYCTL
jgi:hypothetical protein